MDKEFNIVRKMKILKDIIIRFNDLSEMRGNPQNVKIQYKIESSAILWAFKELYNSMFLKCIILQSSPEVFKYYGYCDLVGTDADNDKLPPGVSSRKSIILIDCNENCIDDIEEKFNIDLDSLSMLGISSDIDIPMPLDWIFPGKYTFFDIKIENKLYPLFVLDLAVSKEEYAKYKDKFNEVLHYWVTCFYDGLYKKNTKALDEK